MLILLIVIEAMGILLPYFSGIIIDSISGQNSYSFVPVLGLIGTYFLFLLAQKGVHYVKAMYEVKNFVFDFRPDVFHLGIKNFFSFSAGEHAEGNSHKKASVMNQGIRSAQDLMNITFYQIGPMTFKIIALLVALYFIKPVFMLIVLVSIVINIGLQVWLTNKSMAEFDLWQTFSQTRFKMIGEHIRNADLTKNMGAEDLAIKDVMSYVGKAETKGKNLWVKFDTKLHLINLLTPITIIVLFTVSSWQAYLGMISIGQFLMVISWGGMATANLAQFQWFQRNIMHALPAFRDYRAQLGKESALVFPDEPIKNAITEGVIEFKKISHSYGKKGKKQFQMKNVSFKIEAGKKVALAGVSGSGKSTLVKILLRNFDPEKGDVFVDSHNVKDLDLADYLSNIGYVSQETRLFDSTIKKNLKYGLKRRVTDKELVAALDLANLKDKIMQSKKKLNSKIGEQGIQLSGGERQRLAIARAMLRAPKILIFDEATSNLDAINEKEIQGAIDKAAKGRTAIMIAHRLSTVINADKIFFFENGKLAAEGTHKELLKKSKKYKELCSHQYLDI
jgi:ABC-type multidrug transport system fused ATPase/permease subunit